MGSMDPSAPPFVVIGNSAVICFIITTITIIRLFPDQVPCLAYNGTSSYWYVKQQINNSGVVFETYQRCPFGGVTFVPRLLVLVPPSQHQVTEGHLDHK
jgi:hypothetical protein